MKKVLLSVICVLLAFALTACGSSKTESEDNSTELPQQGGNSAENQTQEELADSAGDTAETK